MSGVQWVVGSIPFGGGCAEVERRFKVEAKSFSFSAKPGTSTSRLEERRKGFGGFINLGFRYADWVVDTVEEALLAQGTGDFAKSFREEVEVLRVSKGSNKAGNFLEVAVFVEGNQKRTIWLPEGRRGWGWRRFVSELRKLLVLGVALISTKVSGGIPTRDGASPSASPVIVKQSDLFPMADWSKGVKGGEETQTLVNWFELEYGLPFKEEAGGGRPAQGGGASTTSYTYIRSNKLQCFIS